MSDQADLRWDVPTAEALRHLAAQPLPLGLRSETTVRCFHRDLYLDTPDGALREKGATCRMRLRSDGRRELSLVVVDGPGPADLRRLRAETTTDDPLRAVLEQTEPARAVRGMVNPATLGVALELETQRVTRLARRAWPRRARFALHYDMVTVRAGGVARAFQELVLRERRAGRPTVAELSRALGDDYGLRSVVQDRRSRGAAYQVALENEAFARGIGGGRWVVVAALDGPHVACVRHEGTLRLPAAEGSGEAACRHLMVQTFGSSVGDLHLLATVPGEERLRAVEVWLLTHADVASASAIPSGVRWLPLEEMLAQADTIHMAHAPTLAALRQLDRAGIRAAPDGLAFGHTAELRAVLPPKPRNGDGANAPPMLDGELSLLEFNARVLEMAEDESIPLLERIRYVSIAAANFDEFFQVRVGKLKYGGPDDADDDAGADVAQRLPAIRRRVLALLARQRVCADDCLRALEAYGVRVLTPEQLAPAQREYLRSYFRSTVFPYLTPRAITSTPGHPLPMIPDLILSVAVILRDARGSGPPRVAELALPAALPRFIALPEGGDFVAIEDCIRPHVQLLYPGRVVEGVHLFRVTRDAELNVDERRSGNLADAIEEQSHRRRHRPIVRVEVESSMPASLREMLLRELRLEPGALPASLGGDDVYDVHGLMDPGALRQLASLPMPSLRWPSFEPRPPMAERASLWETLRGGDILLHHPYDDFGANVLRFFDEAADDPDVVAIRATLYRAGDQSPIVAALLRAAAAGKDVSAFVELKARFDERRNVRWARQLEAAGAHVVLGVLGAKNHSKAALVVRREGDTPRRYAHIGTGNYNADTARVYTDFGLLTARESLCADINDLFNALTGSSVPTLQPYRECLVAPSGLLSGLLERIRREAAHARAGYEGRIRMKLNGLSDPEVVQALYAASQDGVTVELVVRGICTLSPGVPGVSERIRVVSILGRFLEHARVYWFANAGAPECFIGSADLRPRNLRRRVELIAPIHDAVHRAQLERVLDLELSDPTAWELTRTGEYVRRNAAEPGSKPGSQARLLLADVALSVAARSATAAAAAQPAQAV